MKITSLLIACLLVIAACSPNAETTVEDAEPQTEVIENNTESEEMSDDTEMEESTDNMESDDMDMDESADDMESDDMDMDESTDDMESDEHSDMDMDDSADDMESDMDMDESADDMTESDDMDMDESIDEMTDDAVMDDSASAMVAYNGPDWADLELVNAKTGETFTFADFAGKTVFVEPMATWCTNCRAQQRRIREVVDQLSPDEFVVMSLSVETNLSPQDLADYAEQEQFGWTFAVASDEMVTALVEEFGRSVSSPPSVPHFTISADGANRSFSTGSKSGEDFLALVRGIAAES